jgi:hypothetical protein
MSCEFRGWAIFILLAAPGCASQIDVETIVQRSVAANSLDWKEAPDFSYSERDQDASGARTYEVSMILGSPYRRLLAIDDKPLSQANQRKQQRRQTEALARRRAETKTARTSRTARYERERKRDRLMMDQLTEAFDFKLVGEERIGSHDTYVLKATPRAGYRPPNTETEVLTGMQGKLWIDKASFQWVKVEAEVVHPVSIAGFLARVETGTRFELEKEPVADGVWLPSHFAMQSRATILHIVTRRGQEDDTYSGYHKTGEDTTGETPFKFMDGYHICNFLKRNL